MDTQLERSVRAAIDFLETQGYRYALVGGLALAQWGVVRATYDVDIKVLVPRGDYAEMRASLQAAFPNPARPHLPEHSLVVAVSIHEVIVDFLLALPGYEELIIERATLRDLGGWSVWICSAEDLIIQKVVAERDKDWVDVEALLIAQGNRLDQIYIEEWLTQFAEALEKPDLVREYKRVLKKSGMPD